MLDGLALMGQWSLINYLHMYDYKNVRMKLPDKISITPFQQYLAKTFPEDGKHSTSSGSQVTLDGQCLLKDPPGAW